MRTSLVRAALMASAMVVPELAVQSVAAQNQQLSSNCQQLIDRLADANGEVRINNQPGNVQALQQLAEANNDSDCRLIVENMEITARSPLQGQQTGSQQGQQMSGQQSADPEQLKQNARQTLGTAEQAVNSDPEGSTQQLQRAEQAVRDLRLAATTQDQQQRVQEAQQLVRQAREAAQRGESERAAEHLQQAHEAVEQLQFGQSGGTMGQMGSFQTANTGSGQQNASSGNSNANAAAREGERQMSDEELEYRGRYLSRNGDPQMGNAQMRPMRVSDLEDRDIKNARGEELGEVEQVVMVNGQPHVVIRHGGFLGLGASENVIPLDRLTLVGDDLIFRGMTEDELDQLRKYRELQADEIREDREIQVNAQMR